MAERLRRVPKGVWGALFLVAGILTPILAFAGPLYALAMLVATVFFGYRIWRAGHRYESAWRAAGSRVAFVGSLLGAGLSVSVVRAVPELLVLLLVGVLLLAVIGGTALWFLARTEDRLRRAPGGTATVTPAPTTNEVRDPVSGANDGAA